MIRKKTEVILDGKEGTIVPGEAHGIDYKIMMRKVEVDELNAKIEDYKTRVANAEIAAHNAQSRSEAERIAAEGEKKKLQNEISQLTREKAKYILDLRNADARSESVPKLEDELNKLKEIYAKSYATAQLMAQDVIWVKDVLVDYERTLHHIKDYKEKLEIVRDMILNRLKKYTIDQQKTMAPIQGYQRPECAGLPVVDEDPMPIRYEDDDVQEGR